MAAVLRYAARKLGGSALQRRPVAVVVDEPRLIPGRSRSTSSSAAGNHTEGLTAREERTLIQGKSEELYHRIAKNKSLRRHHRELLQHLSVVVQPKPSDPIWCFYRRAKRFNDIWLVLAIFIPGRLMVHTFLERDQVTSGEAKSVPGGDKQEL